MSNERSTNVQGSLDSCQGRPTHRRAVPLSPHFQATLRKALTNAAAAKEEIASKVGVSRGTLYNWRDGIHRPGRDEVERLAAVLDLPLVELWVPDEPLEETAQYRLAVLERMAGRLRELLAETERELAGRSIEPAAPESGVAARQDVGSRGERRPARRRAKDR